jgi:hypothetical protein
MTVATAWWEAGTHALGPAGPRVQSAAHLQRDLVEIETWVCEIVSDGGYFTEVVVKVVDVTHVCSRVLDKRGGKDRNR